MVLLIVVNAQFLAILAVPPLIYEGFNLWLCFGATVKELFTVSVQSHHQQTGIYSEKAYKTPPAQHRKANRQSD